MKYLYYNCLKDCVDYKVDLPIEVAEFLAKDLRESIKLNLDKNKIVNIYDNIEKTTSLLYQNNEDFSLLYLKDHNID